MKVNLNNIIGVYMKKNDIKPFIKWAGGKGQLVETIKQRYPMKKYKIDKYIEPFIGGGAVLFDLLGEYSFKKIYISDINEELINTYVIIRDDVENLILILEKMQAEYISLDEIGRKEYFYKIREQYNDEILSEKNKVKKAALFLFLNKTCFNGLYRVNKKGKFNVPIGSYKNPKICDSMNLRNVSKSLSNIEIKNSDYRECIDLVDEKTFVYIDPPYRPLNNTSSFKSYSKNDFNDNEQIELAKFYRELDKKGAFVILSNSDPKNIDENDEFFDDLYSDYNIERIEAKRVINSKSSNRGAIKEILVSNFKVDR